ncbi:hypothetical protein O3S68_02805 [Kosakonia sp. SOY2]|uniref:hypothetical protein n=1 Tax=Kosakonia sp. SOY2 TaxID=3014557 RepID=UPI0022AC03F5|nr:hypothetical protein [Kosakonia sp. SOY2]MCZ3381223.1 hypothetical protein [Kosakonia sp. SOY2]
MSVISYDVPHALHKVIIIVLFVADTSVLKGFAANGRFFARHYLSNNLFSMAHGGCGMCWRVRPIKEELSAARQNGSARSWLGQNEGKGDCRI